MTSPLWLICWNTLIQTTPALEMDQTKQFIQIFLVFLKIARGSKRMLGKKIRPSWTNLIACMINFQIPFGFSLSIFYSICVDNYILFCNWVAANRPSGAATWYFLKALLYWADLKPAIAAEASPIGKIKDLLNICFKIFLFIFNILVIFLLKFYIFVQKFIIVSLNE